MLLTEVFVGVLNILIGLILIIFKNSIAKIKLFRIYDKPLQVRVMPNKNANQISKNGSKFILIIGIILLIIGLMVFLAGLFNISLNQ